MGIIISVVMGIIIFVIKCTIFAYIIHFIGKAILKIKNKDFSFKLVLYYFAISFLGVIFVDYALGVLHVNIPFSSEIIATSILYYLISSQLKLGRKQTIILSLSYLLIGILISILIGKFAIYYFIKSRMY